MLNSGAIDGVDKITIVKNRQLILIIYKRK